MDREMLKARARTALRSAGAVSDQTNDVPQDVFMWLDESGQDQWLLVPWKTRTERAVAIEREGEAWINAASLPNGKPARSAAYAGCIARDATADYSFPGGPIRLGGDR